MRLRGALLPGLFLLATAASCRHATTGSGGSHPMTTSSVTSGAGGMPGVKTGPPIVNVMHPQRVPIPGSPDCTVTVVDNVAYEGATHVPICTPVSYVSNPPSSGNHWPIWAAYKEYTAHVPREMYAHDIEHGAIVMLYNCTGGPCPDIIKALEQARDAYGADPLCVQSDPSGPPARFVITPDTETTAPIALAAHQAIYLATCIDPPSIAAFVKAHYGQGTEATCYDGKDPTDPSTGIPACMPLPY